MLSVLAISTELLSNYYYGLFLFWGMYSIKGQFKGMLFRHVIKHYVIQAGDMNKLGAAEEWTLKGKHYDQLDTRSLN